MSRLGNLIAEFYDWRGYLVKRNVKAGRLSHGGWEMELDVVAYHPHTKHLCSHRTFSWRTLVENQRTTLYEKFFQKVNLRAP